MTEPRDQRVYLEDILDAIDKAESFVGDHQLKSSLKIQRLLSP